MHAFLLRNFKGLREVTISVDTRSGLDTAVFKDLGEWEGISGEEDVDGESKSF